MNCSILYSTTIHFNNADSIVVIPISMIRKANIKLIEGNYYKSISYQKDTIIDNLNKIIIVNNSVISDLENQIAYQIKINNNIQKELNKKNKTNNILIGSTTTSFIGIIVLILLL